MEVVKILTKYFPSLVGALMETVKLSVLSLVFALILGVFFGLFRISKNKFLRGTATAYVEIIRGTPLMVQAFIIYYGIAQVLKPTGFSWAEIGGAFIAGTVTLSLNAGAFMAEIIRGGIEAVDIGQMEAARSLGLSYTQALRKVILPQAFRIMLPSIINQCITSLKDTSILSVIGIRELTMSGKILAGNSTSLVMAIWIVIAMFYFAVCFALSLGAKYLEVRLKYGK
ncbi:amino acid ABC transporter permease [Fusobacterium sp. SB021]|uniref:amino acid ABC transporter permease n=1 Tax=Fusobacterium sp. SB021 TaxID=2744227 RepID=UPI003CFB5539